MPHPDDVGAHRAPQPWAAEPRESVDYQTGPSEADPTHGETFLALGEGEQASQAFCEPLTDGAPIHVELDLTRLDIGAGIVPETEQVILEIWGGLSLDCSRHDLLWASPVLAPSWETYCITLRPQGFMTQLTLRANADGSLTTSAYLLVDNMRVVDGCP